MLFFIQPNRLIHWLPKIQRKLLQKHLEEKKTSILSLNVDVLCDQIKVIAVSQRAMSRNAIGKKNLHTDLPNEQLYLSIFSSDEILSSLLPTL